MPMRSHNGLARLIAALYGRLYGEWSWAYDGAVWLVSAGLWQRWALTTERYLAGDPVVEIGCGRGRLLARLAGHGRAVIGVDCSEQMVRAAQRRLRNAGLPGNAIAARAQALPFKTGSVGTLVMTFAGPYVFDPATLEEVARVLRPDGRWILVGEVSPRQRTPRFAAMWALALVYRLAGVGPRSITTDLFELTANDPVPVGPTTVRVKVLRPSASNSSPGT